MVEERCTRIAGYGHGGSGEAKCVPGRWSVSGAETRNRVGGIVRGNGGEGVGGGGSEFWYCLQDISGVGSWACEVLALADDVLTFSNDYCTFPGASKLVQGLRDLNTQNDADVHRSEPKHLKMSQHLELAESQVRA